MKIHNSKIYKWIGSNQKFQVQFVCVCISVLCISVLCNVCCVGVVITRKVPMNVTLHKTAPTYKPYIQLSRQTTAEKTQCHTRTHFIISK